MTVENNKDLATLLASEDYELAMAFAVKYEGRTIMFDANIAAMAPHDSYKTRYDILFTAGDYSETSQKGPSFTYRDVNFLDMNFTGASLPESFGLGDNLRVTALVGEFNAQSGLFMLKPVETLFR